MRNLSPRLVLVGLAAFGLFVAGCSSGGKAQAGGQKEIQAMVRLFTRFIADHQGRGPKNYDEFVKHVKQLKKEDLESMQITDVDSVLKSPRDNKPYGVVYGIVMGGQGAGEAKPAGKGDPAGASPGKTGGAGPAMKQVVVYERQGVSGRRYVGYMLGGSFEELSEEEFKQLVPNPES